VLLVACAPVAALFLHQAAQQAYASQVNYTTALVSAPVRSHTDSGAAHAPGAHAPGAHAPGAHPSGAHPSAAHAPAARAPVTAAPYAFIDQTAHALQDGLAGQAAGLPVASLALLWGSRAGARSRHVSKGGTEDERARPV
jgi:hypothetical protein